MKLWIRASLKLIWASYLLLTSLYCLLAFLPYTYYALINAPAYPWMPWFVHHHAHLYWAVLVGAAAAYWNHVRRRAFAILFGALIVGGFFITARPFLPQLHANPGAYVWGIVVLIPLLLFSVLDVLGRWPGVSGLSSSSLSYSPVVLAAMTIAFLTLLGSKIRAYSETRSATVGLGNLEVGAWTLITHVVLAVVVVSLLNLIFAIAAKTKHPRLASYSMVVIAIWIAVSAGLVKFLDRALNFSGWPAQFYAVLLAATLIFFGLSMVLGAWPGVWNRNRKTLLVATMAALGLVALVLPWAVGEWDWNGVFQSVFTVLLWLVLNGGFSMWQGKRRAYSVPATLAILLLTGFSYKALQWTEIFWGKALGRTDAEIDWSLEKYALQNTSFQLAHHLLGNAPVEERCADLCRLLKQYTNIRDADTKTKVNLVDTLVPNRGERPNIFIFVIDSMRPDYLGAYNPKVDFTSKMDAFANDSIVFRNAYTQYAGTTLSEPAIWSGALLLHAHYLRPFENVNSLEKLVDVDGYKMIVSFDTVLKALLSPPSDAIKLDTDKAIWTNFELCSTIQQLTKTLDDRADKTQPVFFYAQPMNVHMFAQNKRPLPPTMNWLRSGFNSRIAGEVSQVDECMGSFLSYLKARGQYDNSIIILASDHGEATGEFGRQTHSTIIYPEVMRVPLIVHLPKSMQGKFVDDRDRVSTLTDITPSLYYLLGHRPVNQSPMYGRPLLAETKNELDSYPRNDVFFASDEVAVYGLLAENGRYMYATYASPARSCLFDLVHDPNAEHNIVTDELKRKYDQRVLDYLRMISDFYGYQPGFKSLLASSR